VYGGMGINLAIYAAVLLLGVTQQWPGVRTAAGGLVLAIVIEYWFLHVRSARMVQRTHVQHDERVAAVL
jgi:type VI protein secretion system component VasK